MKKFLSSILLTMLLYAQVASAAVPTVITDLSTTASSNSPAGTDPIGTSLDDFLRVIQKFERQLFDTATIYSSTVGGTADVITLTPTPALTAYKAGQCVSWIASGANTTNVTINVSGLGAKAVTKNGATALTAGNIPSGATVSACYDGTQFQLQSVAGGGITALTGDVTASGTGSVAATLATVNSNVGSFGTATQSPTLTLNGKGLVTAASNTTITPAESSVTFTDITTNNASTTKHGYLAKLSNSATQYMDGTGNWSTPAGGMVLLSTATPSAASTVDFTGISSTYSKYIFVFSKVTNGTAAGGIGMRYSLNSGSTYLASGDYSAAYSGVNEAGTAAVGNNTSANTAYCTRVSDGGNVSREYNGFVEIYSPSTASSLKGYISHFSTSGPSGSISMTSVGGGVVDTSTAASSAVNAVRFIPLTGTLTGTIKMYGVQ